MRAVLLGIVVVICLVLIGLWRSDNPRLTQVRLALADTVSPSFGFIAEPIAYANEILRDYRALIDVYDQNRALREEIDRLQVWRSTARALEEENARLRALMNVRPAPRLGFVTGDVIADSGGPFSESALVNVGQRDGVVDGSAAVDGSGLVGRVVGVGERAARVMFVTDFSSRVPVIIEPSGQRAILSGDATRAPVLEFLGAPDRVNPGDTVRTSGDGGVFPPHLPVGTVVRTDRTWRALLSADFQRLEFVRLLRYNPNTAIDRPGGIVGPDRRPFAEQPATGAGPAPPLAETERETRG
ncbi:MAG: rod shape-determining protein MreC [Pseudomonadota bacterium]